MKATYTSIVSLGKEDAVLWIIICSVMYSIYIVLRPSFGILEFIAELMVELFVCE